MQHKAAECYFIPIVFNDVNWYVRLVQCPVVGRAERDGEGSGLGLI